MGRKNKIFWCPDCKKDVAGKKDHNLNTKCECGRICTVKSYIGLMFNNCDTIK
jgi:hypothetical protein